MLNSTHKTEKKAEKRGGKAGKVLLKLMNNAAYGKTMENVRNRFDMRFVNSGKDFLKWTSKNNLHVTENI